MSTSDVTSPEWVSVPQILADLIVFGRQNNLPDPAGLEANGENGCGHIKLKTFGEHALWVKALGIEGPIPTPRKSAGERQFVTMSMRRSGWFITIGASEQINTSTELPAETLAALDHIASGS